MGKCFTFIYTHSLLLSAAEDVDDAQCLLVTLAGQLCPARQIQGTAGQGSIVPYLSIHDRNDLYDWPPCPRGRLFKM